MTSAEPPGRPASDAPAPNLVEYVLRLFVAGTSWRSQRAVENLRRLCDERLAGQADLEVIDIYQQPELAERHQVVATPTLVRLAPAPVRRIVGDLSDRARLLRGLDLPFEAIQADLPEADPP